MAKFSAVNQTPATGPAAMYIVKTVLTNAGATVQRSGDGLALYSSSGDIITTGAAGAGGLGQANAWFEIKFGTVAYTFQMITNTTWRVKMSETGAFAGGTPGISRTGTATDEQVIYGAGTDASPTGTQMLHTDNTYKFHCVANSAAQASGTLPFWFGCTVNTTGVCASLFAVDGLLTGSYNVLDVSPRVLITWYVSTGPVTTGWMTNGSDAALYARAWFAYGTGSAAFKRYAMPTYFFDGTSAANHTGGPATSVNGSLAQNAWVQDTPLPVVVARHTTLSTQVGLKGVLSNIKTSSYVVATRFYPWTLNNASGAYVYYGGLLLSWPDGVTAVA